MKKSIYVIIALFAAAMLWGMQFLMSIGMSLDMMPWEKMPGSFLFGCGFIATIYGLSRLMDYLKSHNSFGKVANFCKSHVSIKITFK